MKEWFKEQLNIIDMEQVKELQSSYGNNFYKITKEQLELLKQDKVLEGGDEYGIFIILEDDKD